MKRIIKAWLILGLAILFIGVWSYVTGTAHVYERGKGIYSVSMSDDPARYWTFTIMYLNGFLFCIFAAFKNLYPASLNKLMDIGFENHLSFSKVVFIMFLAVLFFGSSFYFYELIANT